MKKFLLNLLYIILAVTAVICIHNYVFMPGCHVSFCEDLFEPYIAILLGDGFGFYRNNFHNSLLYSLFYDLICIYLPRILDIHPITCFVNISSYIISFIIFSYLFAISFTFSKYIKKESNLLPFVICLFLFPVHISALEKSTTYYLYYNEAWMTAYLVLPIFVATFFNEFEIHFVLKEALSKKQTIILFLLLFCVANSFEILRYITFVFFAALICLYFLFDKEKKHIGLYKSLFVFYTALNLFLVIIYKGSNYIHFIDLRAGADKLIPYFKGFFLSYYQYIVANNAITLGLIIFSLICIMFLTNNNEKKKAFWIFTGSLFFAVMSYPLSTILINFNPEGWIYSSYFTFACDHSGTRYTINYFLIMILFSCWGFLFSSMQNMKAKIVLLLTYIVMLIPAYHFTFLKDSGNWHNLLKEADGRKFFDERNTNLYILEKFWAMYGRRHGEFYTYSPHNVTYYDLMINYLAYLYSENKLLTHSYDNPEEYYKIIHVCSDEDDLFTTCKDKMLKVIKDKTGYEFSEEELKKLDFESIREYSYNY